MVTSHPAQPGFYMMLLHRSRIASLRGRFAWLKRFSAGRRIRSRLKGDLRQYKAYISVGASATEGSRGRCDTVA